MGLGELMGELLVFGIEDTANRKKFGCSPILILFFVILLLWLGYEYFIKE